MDVLRKTLNENYDISPRDNYNPNQKSSISCNLFNLKKDLTKWKNLSTESQNDYILRAQNGDETALLFVLGGVSSFLYKQANLYANNNMLDAEDLYIEGLLGVMEAIDKFEPKQDVKFLSFASIYSKCYMLKFVRNCGSVIRIPAKKLESYFRIKNKLKYDNDSTEIISLLKEEDMDVEDYYKIYQIRHIKSLNQKSCDVMGSTGLEALELIDMIEDPDTNTLNIIIDMLTEEQLKELMNDVLQTLSEKEQYVLKMRHGFFNGKEYTLQEIGDIFGLTKERIRQIENKSLRKLRSNIYRRNIKFIDEYCI